MKKYLLLLSLSFMVVSLLAQSYKQNETPTYDDIIEHYSNLADKYEEAFLYEIGKTDVGRTLHVFILNAKKQLYPEDDQVVWLINNGIHPGEPCGVDASMDNVNTWLKEGNFPENVFLAVIPIYNVGGALNRSCCSRANQNGPKEYGFRGNARNLDLNRDFIKMDSRNAEAFVKLFRKIDPDVFLDTHSTNGADYQYTMTLITTQVDKLGGELGRYVDEEMVPTLFNEMKKKGEEMTPYVNVWGRTPREGGIHAFLETPRYSTGYTSLFNTIGFTSEAHMWKPFPQRVEATKKLMEVLLDYLIKNGDQIKDKRAQTAEEQAMTEEFPVYWELDSSRVEFIAFKGYQDSKPASEVTKLPLLEYDQAKKVKQQIPFYNHYRATRYAQVPKYYLLPQAWREVVKRLELNQVKMEKLEKDSIIEVTSTYIANYEGGNKMYEGHYPIRNVEVFTTAQQVQFYKGDLLIPSQQEARRFLVETLSPQSHDSYFSWNFFNAILGQKEWFSAYVFDEKALDILDKDPQLNKEFRYKQEHDTNFSKNNFAQLYWIYKRSKYYEKTHNRYPVFYLNR